MTIVKHGGNKLTMDPIESRFGIPANSHFDFIVAPDPGDRVTLTRTTPLGLSR